MCIHDSGHGLRTGLGQERIARAAAEQGVSTGSTAVGGVRGVSGRPTRRACISTMRRPAGPRSTQREPASGMPMAATPRSVTRPLATPRYDDLSVVIRQVQRVLDWHEIDNLQSAYGYYAEKSLWTDIAALFTSDWCAGDRRATQRRSRQHPGLPEILRPRRPREGRVEQPAATAAGDRRGRGWSQRQGAFAPAATGAR